MKHINLQLSPELLEDLKIICKEQGVSINFYMRAILNDSINKYYERRTFTKDNQTEL